MPLYNYKCNKCEYIMEKFQHNNKNVEDVKCDKCSGECAKVMGVVYNRTWLNSRENYARRIKPEVDRISNNISKGKDNDFLDIYGEK